MTPPIINPLKFQESTKCFVHVNKNPIKFNGEAIVEVKTEKSNEKLPILVTENKDTQALLGLYWQDRLEIGLQGNKNTDIIRNVVNIGRREKIVGEFGDLF